MLKLIRQVLFPVNLFLALGATLPFCILRPFSTKNSAFFFQAFHFLVSRTMGINIYIEGRENLDKNHPSVLIANHQHNLDVFSISTLMSSHVVILGKHTLGFIPLFGQVYVLAGHILVNRSNRKKSMLSMNKLTKRIKEKALTILVFPEGHRNEGSQLLPFKKGAFHTAIRTQVPLVPASISQFTQEIDFSKWHSGNIYIKVHPPISVEGKTKADIPQLMEESKRVIEEGITEVNLKYNQNI